VELVPSVELNAGKVLSGCAALKSGGGDFGDGVGFGAGLGIAW